MFLHAAGNDYIGVSTELTFPSGTVQNDLMHFIVTILSPDCVEEREFFNLRLSAGPSGSPDPAIIIIPDRQEATVNIDDSSREWYTVSILFVVGLYREWQFKEDICRDYAHDIILLTKAQPLEPQRDLFTFIMSSPATLYKLL